MATAQTEFEALVSDLKKVADEYPFDPTRCGAVPLRHRRVIRLEEWKVSILFTRTVVGMQEFYQLSINQKDSAGRSTPDAIIHKIQQAFVPKGVPLESMLGNTIQFIQPIQRGFKE